MEQSLHQQPKRSSQDFLMPVMEPVGGSGFIFVIYFQSSTSIYLFQSYMLFIECLFEAVHF